MFNIAVIVVWEGHQMIADGMMNMLTYLMVMHSPSCVGLLLPPQGAFPSGGRSGRDGSTDMSGTREIKYLTKTI